MIWNLFKKDKEEKDDDNLLEDRIKDALRKAEEGKRNEAGEIKEMIDGAKEVIIDTYIDFLPNAQYSYYRDQVKETILVKYDEIKNQHASKLDPEIADKSDKIVQGYLNQASLRETKIEFYDKLINQYSEAIQKLEKAKERAEKIEKLNKHSEKLSQLDEDTSELAETYVAGYEFEDIKKEFELKEEFYKQMEVLSLEYSDSKTSYENSLAYKDEVEKLNKKLI